MKSTGACVSDIIGVMEKLAPPALAEQWDNCGLQVGSSKWPVKKIWVALDPLSTVVKAAVAQKVDLLVTHHPLVFQPLNQIDVETEVGGVIASAIKGQMAIFAAHTNLDSALEGVNDVLAHKIGLRDLVPLIPADEPLDDIYGDENDLQPGLGRIGSLSSPVSVDALAEEIKSRFGIEQVTIAGNTGLTVSNVAVCSGSGAGLMDAFLASDAQVYVSGDLKYHQARIVEAADRAMIDIGHFASEHIMVDALAATLQDALQTTGWAVNVEACQLEKDPFVHI